MPEVNLENDEKSRIREEEAFRFKVQKELVSQLPKKWYVLVGRIFNSRVMVAVALGAMGWFGGGEFLKVTDDRNTQRKNDIAAEKLITEIDYRATRTKEYLGNLERYMESGEANKLNEALSDLLLQIAGQMTTGGWDANLFSEYANQSMASLLSQLKLFSKSDGSIQKILDAAIGSTAELQSMSADILSNDPGEAVAKLIIERTKRQLEGLAKVTGKSYLTNGESSD